MHTRVTFGSIAAVLSPLVGIVVNLMGTVPAVAADVLFTEHVISTTAVGARSVFATDVDGDGDIDVLSASFRDDKIAWYESDGGSPPAFTERVISTCALRAVSVFAADVDGDGDMDVLSASLLDNKIAWYENLSPCGFDSDCDGDADLRDFASFQVQFTGPKLGARKLPVAPPHIRVREQAPHRDAFHRRP